MLAAAASLALLVALTMAVDVGSRTLAARDLQGAVDLAALDAVRAYGDLAGVQSAESLALASMQQNGGWFDLGVGDVDVEQAGGSAVRVTAQAQAPGFVLFGDGAIERSAVAELAPPFMTVSVGSRLFSINTEEAELLNGLFGEMLGGVELSAVSYQGLIDGEMTLRGLRQELLAAGYTVGSVDQLLSADITFADLYSASVAALTDESGQNTIDALEALESAVDQTLTLQLGDVLRVDGTNPHSALDAVLNVFDLVKATAYLADGDHFVSVDVPLSVPRTVQLRISIDLIEPPQIAIGPPGETVAETAQVDARIDLVVGSGNLVDIPATIEGATAVGAFTAVATDCSAATVETTTAAARVNPGHGTGPGIAEGFDSWTGLPPATYSVGYEGDSSLNLAGVLEAALDDDGLLGGVLGSLLNVIGLDDLTEATEEAAVMAFDLLGVGVAEADVRLSDLVCHGRHLTG